MQRDNKQNKNDVVDIHVHFHKGRLSTHITLGGALLLIYLLSDSSAVHVVLLLVGFIYLLALVLSHVGKSKIEPRPEPVRDNTPTDNKSQSTVKTKPKPMMDKPTAQPEVELVDTSDNGWAEFMFTEGESDDG